MQVFRLAGLILLVFSAVSANAQFSGLPAPILDTIPSEIHKAMKSRLTADQQTIVAEKSKVKSFIKSMQQDRFDYLVKLFNDDKLIVNSTLNTYLNDILKNIQAANPGIASDVSVYLERNNVANAASYGEGTIIVALSLIARLENEQQLAFILCHELAHYHLKHTEEAVKRFADLNFDKELNREARDIRNSRYGSYTRMRELMKGIDLTENRHSRTKEFEADEFGLKLFLNSKYADVIAPVRTMQILDSVDHEAYQGRLDFKKYFNSPEYLFKDSWLSYKRPDLWQVKKDESDTTKTHPRCQRRAAALAQKLAMLHIPKDSSTRNTYEDVRKQAAVDLIESNYHFKKYGRALFDALVLSEQYPDDPWLHAMIGRCLYQLYVTWNKHELGKALEQTGRKNDESYDRFLSFIHQLRSVELENLTYQYAVTQKVEYFNNEDFLYTLWLCSKLKVSKLSPASVEEDYRAKFPTGRYLSVMK